MHKDITAAMRSRWPKDAKQLLHLRDSSEADIYLHRAFLRALPRWLDRHWAPSSE